jgi:hypothetical protein
MSNMSVGLIDLSPRSIEGSEFNARTNRGFYFGEITTTHVQNSLILKNSPRYPPSPWGGWGGCLTVGDSTKVLKRKEVM